MSEVALDAYALIAFLGDEPGADAVEGLLREAAVASAVNVAETVDRLQRLHGVDVGDDLDALVRAGLEVAALTDELARSAGGLRARHYHRSRSPLSLADCAAAATALHRAIPLATSDGPLAAVVRREGGAVVPLPDSHGRMP